MLLARQIRVQYSEQTEFFWAVQGDATRYLKYAGNLMECGVFSKSKTNGTAPTALYIGRVYFSVISVVTQAEPRYSFPLRPEMYLCAVFFISAMLKSARDFGKREPISIENL
ncbi:MAG: hypothetical protein ACU826_06450 [Gammaproteobacteria bacterium]